MNFQMEKLEEVTAPVKVNWAKVAGYAAGAGTKWYICDNTGICW
ncbi:hypothetical protein [Bacillus sp. BC08]